MIWLLSELHFYLQPPIYLKCAPNWRDFTYDGQDVIFETDRIGAFKAKNFFGLDLVSRQTADDIYYYLFNGHGDVTHLLNEKGYILKDYRYYPFGKDVPEPLQLTPGKTTISLWRNEVENLDNPFRYAGEYLDQETGYYYLRARYYDPQIQRFISEDSYAKSPSWNEHIYAYAEYNPVNHLDPTGHEIAWLNQFGKDAREFALGVGYQFGNDGLFGVPQPIIKEFAGINPDERSRAFQAGRILGSTMVMLQGAVETGAGLGMFTGGGAVTIGSAGSAGIVGVPAMAEGVVLTGVGTGHLRAGAQGFEDSTRAFFSKNNNTMGTGKAKVHGNVADDRPATLYKKVDGEGNLQKWGVTKHENPRKRYTKRQIGDVIAIERGARREMLKKERQLVEKKPGPQNRERWAGKQAGRKPQPVKKKKR